MSKTLLEKKDRSINQLAGDIKRSLKAQGVEYLEDFRGERVPIKYVPAVDILRHGYCQELIEDAKQLQEQVAKFKGKCQQVGNLMYEILVQEDELREDSKGGFTMGLFDKSARIEFRMDTVETQDEVMLKKAKAHKDKYVEEVKHKLDGKIPDDMMYIIDLMNDAFQQTNGKIDPRRRTLLNRYRDRINNKHYDNFLDAYNNAFDLKHTKRYEQFIERDDRNEDESILLNYSKVDPITPEDEDG